MEATQIMDVSDRETVEQDQHLSQKVLATLEILSPSASLGTKFDILFGVNKIGRDPEKCNIALENKTLSRVHAVLEAKDGNHFLIHDQGSSNKSWRNAFQLEPQVRYACQHLDQLTFGEVKMRLTVKEQADEASEEEEEPFMAATQAMSTEDLPEDHPARQDIVVPETPMAPRRLEFAPPTQSSTPAPSEHREATAIPESPNTSIGDRSLDDSSFLAPSQPAHIVATKGNVFDMETQAVLPVVETSTSTNETAAASTLKDSAFFNEETQALLPNGVTPSTSIPKQKLFHEETLALGDQTRSELPTQIEQEIETDEEGENTTLNSVDQTAGTELNKNEEESKSTQPFMVDGAKVTPEGKESADVISTPIVATRTTKSLLSLVEEAPLAKEDDPPTAPTKENAAANETAEGASDVKDKCAMDDDEDDLFLMATQDIVLDVDQEKGLSKETEPADEKKNPPLDSSASGKDNHDVSFESDVSENLLADDLEDGVSTSIVKSGENNSEVAKISPSPVKTQKAKENEADQSIDSEVSTQLESFEEVNGDEKDAQVENQGRSEEDLNGDSNKQSLKLGDASEGLDTTKELSEEQSAEAVSGTGTKAEDLYDAETQNLDDFESDDEIIPNSQDSAVDRTNFVDLPMEMTKSFRTASIKTNVPVVGPESGNQEAEKSYGSDQAIEEKEVEHTLADGRKDGKEESCQNERSEPDCVEGNVETITCDNKEKVNEAETIPLPNPEEESVERKDQPNEQESETIILEELPDISIGEQVNPEEDHVLDEPHDVSGSLDREDMEVEGSPKPMNEDEPSSCSLELPSTQNLLNSVSDASSRPRKYEMESPEEDKLTDSGEDHLIIDESKSRVKKKNTESQAKLPGSSKESDKSSTDPDFSSGQGSKELKNTRKKSAILPPKDKLVTKLVTEENIRKSGRQTKRSSRFANEDFVSGEQAIKRTPADPSPKKKATAPRGNKRMRKEEANNKTESIDGAKALKNEGAEEKQKNIGSSEKTTKPCVEDQSNVNGKEEHVMSNNAGNIDACQVLEEPSPAEAVKLARRSSSKKLDANDFAKELSQIHAKNPRVEECEETSVKTCVAVQPITLKNGIEQSGEEITEIKDVSTEKGTSSSKRGRRSKKPDNNKDFKEEPNSSSQTESNNMEIGNNVQDSKRSRKPRASVNVTPPPRSRGRKGRQSLKDDRQQTKIETALQPTRNSRRPKKKETEVNNTTDGQNIEDEPEEMKRRAGDKKQESHDESLDDIPKTVSGLALVGRSRRLIKKKKVECNVVAEERPESEGRKEANVSNAGNAANDEPAISPVVEPELSNAVEDHKPAEQPLEPIVSESSDKQTRGRRGSRFPTKSPSISPAKSPSRNRAASSPAAPKQVATMTTKTPVASPTKSPAKKGKVAASTTTPVKNLPVQRSSRLSASKLSPKLKEDKPTTDSKHPSPPEISEPATKRARLSGKVVPEASRKLSRSSARKISPCTTPIKKEPESPAKRGRTSKALSEPNVPASQTSQTKNECEVENTSVTEKVSEGRQSRRQKANKSLPDCSVETSTNKRKVLKEDNVSAKDSPPSAKKLKPETPIKRGRGRKTAAEPFPQDIKATEVKIEDVPAQEKATDGRRSARQKSSRISTAAVAEATGAKKRQMKASDNPEPKESPTKKTKPETPVKRGRGGKAAAKSTPQESETIDLNIECKSTTAPQNTAQSRRSGRPNARKMQESEDPPTPKKRKSSTIAPKKTVKVERRDSSATSDVTQSGRRQLKHTVMFTGYDCPQDKKLVKELGGIITDNMSDCTVLVTDKVRRTAKFLCMLAKGVPIVGPGWLAASKNLKMFRDPWLDIISDGESEKKWGFNLKTTLRASQKSFLLSGFKVFATKSVLPPPSEMKDIVESAGGEWLKSVPKKENAGVFVISCAQDKKVLGGAIKANVNIQDKEILLTGLLKGDLDFKKHKLKL